MRIYAFLTGLVLVVQFCLASGCHSPNPKEWLDSILESMKSACGQLDHVLSTWALSFSAINENDSGVVNQSEFASNLDSQFQDQNIVEDDGGLFDTDEPVEPGIIIPPRFSSETLEEFVRIIKLDMENEQDYDRLVVLDRALSSASYVMACMREITTLGHVI